MTLYRINPEDSEVFTIQTNPKQRYISSSNGISGAVYLYSRRLSGIKEQNENYYITSSFVDSDIENIVKKAKMSAVVSGSNFSAINEYMNKISEAGTARRLSEQMHIYRFNPGVALDRDFMAKKSIVKSLYSFYRSVYPTAHFNFTNYNCLNFFTSSNVPSNSALLYPQVTTSSGSTLSGSYIPSGAISFDFWVKPKYKNDTNGIYKPGTLFHLSGSYAVSIISGSSKDVENNVDKYRVLVQFSSSADIAPSNINVNSLPKYCFVSDDNSIIKDSWSHVTVRWGSNSYNLGSGSFVINEEIKGTFCIPSSSIAAKKQSASEDPNVLCIGNYYEGTNAGGNSQALFFAADTAEREGLIQLSVLTGVDQPTNFSFSHPAKCEVHDLKIFNRYLSNEQISDLTNGITTSNITGLLFYLPPFFTEESPWRKMVGTNGGILTTPFTTKDGTTKTPFSIELSAELGGQYINLENYTRDFATGTYPRLFALTASVINSTSTTAESSDEIMYATGSVNKRQMTILPCDNGTFTPNFTVLKTLSGSMFKNDFGNSDIGSVTLRNLYPTTSIFSGILSDGTNDVGRMNGLYGPDPLNSSSLTNPTGSVPCVTQRTREYDSNQVTFFDISNMFYGGRVKPGSIIITDSNISCSFGTSQIVLKDDGYGNIYRADCSGSIATWNSVGNAFYREGIIAIKNPSLYFFGKNQFDVSFEGEQEIHTQKIRCTTFPLMETESSNPSYIVCSASMDANDFDSRYVYLTELLLHDDNLNVVARTKLAQPYMKRTGDKTTIVFQMDY